MTFISDGINIINITVIKKSLSLTAENNQYFLHALEHLIRFVGVF